MNRFLVIFAALIAAGSLNQVRANDSAQLQGRISALENKVRMLETALNELSGRVVEPSPTQVSAPVPPPQVPPSAPAPAAPPVPAPGQKTHVIAKDETLSEIAKQYDIPRAELLAANSLREGEQIYIDDVLIIPSPKSASPAPSAPAPSAPSNSAPSNSAAATPVPAPPPAPSAPAGGATYTVKQGDTLSKIAREHGVTVQAIKSANQLSSDHLAIGQKVKIPGKGNASVANSTPAPAPAAPSGSASTAADPGLPSDLRQRLREGETYGAYIVESGDTLYSLARDFFTTEAELQRLNALGKSTTLRPGNEIVVPTSKYSAHHDLANNN